ncbi:MAG: hypothetical protein AAF653_13385 [Chloroflexota bacterium]
MLCIFPHNIEAASPMPSYLTLFYTQNTRGQFYLLPRIATLLKRLKQQAEGRILLLDAGASCDPSVKLCQQTGGRASIIALDAMGFHAVNVTGFLAEGSREKLAANYLKVALVDALHPYHHEGIAYSAKPPATHDQSLHIALETVTETHLMPAPSQGYIFTLKLRTIGAGQIGQATLSIDSTDVDLVQSTIHSLTPDVVPDATIAGTMEFIEDEARYHSRNQKDNAQGDA